MWYAFFLISFNAFEVTEIGLKLVLFVYMSVSYPYQMLKIVPTYRVILTAHHSLEE